MTRRLITDYAKNYCNRARALIVKVIVQNVVRFFFGTQCSFTKTGLYSTNDTIFKVHILT